MVVQISIFSIVHSRSITMQCLKSELLWHRIILSLLKITLIHMVISTTTLSVWIILRSVYSEKMIIAVQTKGVSADLEPPAPQHLSSTSAPIQHLSICPAPRHLSSTSAPVQHFFGAEVLIHLNIDSN